MLNELGYGIRPRRRKSAGSPVAVESFSFFSSLPSAFTYTRADTVASFHDNTGALQFAASNAPRFDHSLTGVPLGLLIETASTNKNTNVNVNPAATTNLTTSGDPAGVLSVVNDATALAAAGLSAAGPNVFRIDNTAGTSSFIVTIGGTVGNTNPHSFSCYARQSGGIASFQLNSGQGTVSITSAGYQYVTSENITPDTSGRSVRFSVPAGRSVWFILNQLEERRKSSTPIRINGAAATRQKDLLQCTDLSLLSTYAPAEGTAVVEVDFSDIINHGSATGVILADGTGLTNCISSYMIPGRGKTTARVLVNSVSQHTGDIGSVDKAGDGALVRFPMMIAWRNGVEMLMASGAGSFARIPVSGAWTADPDRMIVGTRAFTEEINGHVRSLKIYNKFRMPSQIPGDFVKSGENVILTCGQSNMKGFFSAQTGSTNGGERAGVVLLDSFWGGTRNWMMDGATGGTSVRFMSGISGADDWWLNMDTGERGVPFLRFLEIMGACGQGNIRAIIDASGESDAGNCTREEFKAAQLAKWAIMGASASRPVIQILLGRKTPESAAYQTIRQAQKELAAENPSFVHIAPEKIDLALTDTIHLTDAAYATCATRTIRKTLKVLGETVTGGIDGPRITAVSRSGATLTVTITHDTGTDFTPTSAISGFVFFDNTTEIAISSAVRTNSTTITLTLASAPTQTSQSLYYGYGSLAAAVTANLVIDTSAQALPLRTAAYVSSNAGASFASL